MSSDLLINILQEELETCRGKKNLLALSSGVDSWLLLYLLMQKKIDFDAFTMNFEKEEYCEFKTVRNYASKIRLNLHSKYVSSSEMLKKFDSFSKSTGIVIYNLHPVSKWILAEHAALNKYENVITGDGADQNFRGEKDCDLLPITKKCFEHFEVELTIPFMNKAFFNLRHFKKYVQQSVQFHMPEFNTVKKSAYYPDDFSNSCLHESQNRVNKYRSVNNSCAE